MKNFVTLMVAVFLLLPAGALANGAVSKVRILHLSPDAPSVDVLVNGHKLYHDLEFKERSGYRTLEAGKEYQFQVVPAGKKSPVVIDADLEFMKGRWYTIAAVNKLGAIKPLLIQDYYMSIPKDQSMIRFVHASPDAPAVDVALKDGAILFPDVKFEDIEKYIKVGKGTYRIQVKLAGTESVVLNRKFTLEGGRAYTVYATGLVSDGTLGSRITTDSR